MATTPVAMVTTRAATARVAMVTAEERRICRMIIFALFFYANLLTEPTRGILCSFEGVSPDFGRFSRFVEDLSSFWGLSQFIILIGSRVIFNVL
jgi:hypothetical protein